MKNKNGFSLAELLVTILVSSILILAVGSISSMGMRSHHGYRNKGRIFNDIKYALRVTTNETREAYRVTIDTKGSPWIGSQLVLQNVDGSPNEVIGVYQESGAQDLVYLSDESDVTTRRALLSVPSPGTLSFTINEAIAGTTFELTFTGERDDIPFDLTATVKRRGEI